MTKVSSRRIFIIKEQVPQIIILYHQIFSSIKSFQKRNEYLPKVNYGSNVQVIRRIFPLLALCVPLSVAHKLELETRYSTRDDTRTDSTRREAEWTARADEKRGKTRWREGRGSGKEENKKRETCELSERTLESYVWGKGEEEQHIHTCEHMWTRKNLARTVKLRLFQT